MKSIAPFPDLTLSFTNGRWLAAIAWGDKQSLYFCKHRSAGSSLLSPPHSHKSRQIQAEVAGRWVFDGGSDADVPKAWAEAHRFVSRFCIVWLHLGGAVSLDAVAIITAGIVIAGDVDLIRLSSASMHQDLLAEEWGDELEVFSHNSQRGLHVTKYIELNPAAWWQHPRGAQALAKLAYLRKRKLRARL